MAECLTRLARCREIVPIESWQKDGVEGWLFRDFNNNLVFIPSTELLEFQSIH